MFKNLRFTRSFVLKKVIAFSLIELMISLITISCITAAFTPIITKKLKNSNISIALSELSTKCQAKFGSECSLCYSQKCVACSRYCNDNQYKNIETCLCENCTDRDQNCIRCDGKYCLRCKEGFGYYETNHNCLLCNSGTISDGTTICNPCSKGKYQPNTGEKECIKSDKGYYVADDGASAQTPCPAGEFQNETGKETCKPCTGSTYSLGGAIECSTCSSKTPNCTACSNTTGTCTSCASGFSLSSGTCKAKNAHSLAASGEVKTISIDSSTMDVKISYLVGAGGGGGGGNVKKETVAAKNVNQSFCESHGWIYFASGPHCATPRNAGDGNGTNAPSANQINAWVNNGTCLVRGSNPNAPYALEGRALCKSSVANDVCRAWSPDGISGWRIPNAGEHAAWWSNLSTGNTINLCNRYGRCNVNYVGTCTSVDWKSPYFHWSTNGYWYFDNCAAAGFVQDTWRQEGDTNSYQYPRAFASVRCVLTQIPASSTETPMTGGTGGSGNTASNVLVPQSSITSAIGGYIRITAGTGGAGGVSGANGSKGNVTKVEIVNSSGTVIWTKSVDGGNGGGAASTSNNGSNGSGGGGWNGYGAGGAGGSGSGAGATGGAGYASISYKDAN